MDEQLESWDGLRVVLAVARAGSLSGAARTLRVSHPTVLRRINRIEARLGVRLFERRRSGYTPTVGGDELIAAAARMEDDILDLERRIAGRDLRPSGTVRVTTTDTLLIDFLTPVFAAFRRACPDIRLDVAVSNEIFSLGRREADVAIRPSADVPEALVGRRLGPVATAVYAPAALCPAGAAAPDMRDLPWVAPDDSLSHLPTTRWLRECGLEDRVVYRANSLLACLDAVRSGIGAAALPCYLADGAAATVRLGAPVAELASELWLLTHPDLRHVARIRAFLDAMADALARRRPALAGVG